MIRIPERDAANYMYDPAPATRLEPNFRFAKAGLFTASSIARPSLLRCRPGVILAGNFGTVENCVCWQAEHRCKNGSM